MSFSDVQVRQLKARLKPDHVRSRVMDGQIFSYLEGWHVVAEANRIFGFDGWDRETVASACVYSKQVHDRYHAVYTVRVRIKVRAGDNQIVREASGVGDANAASPGQAHDLGLKAGNRCHQASPDDLWQSLRAVALQGTAQPPGASQPSVTPCY
jgi:recombination DNA repair RAD52 pathway protein